MYDICMSVYACMLYACRVSACIWTYNNYVYSFHCSVAPISCSAGQYSLAGSITCTTCPAGYQCANTSIAPQLCPQGYQSVVMSITCTTCPAGVACPASYDPTMNYMCPEGQLCHCVFCPVVCDYIFSPCVCMYVCGVCSYVCMSVCICACVVLALEMTVGHWPFFDQFHHLTDHNLF